MSRELDVKVARAMGYCAEDVHGDGWAFSKNIAAARTMEDWIEEHGLQKGYGHAMEGVLIDDGRLSNLYEINAWHFIHATPEQRCRAFLAAMEAQ